jgi:oligo-1,6-glucosidase
MTRPEPEKWWHRAVGYQIYPRSFADSDGDGVGDLRGIISRLDHLADLGIGFIWLSPVYPSPQADNGYDISDYRGIAPEYGTLDDFDRLVSEAKARGIGIVMDLVVNHTSAAHPWFRAASRSTEAPEHDYYVWRAPGPGGSPPDDRRAAFGGPAWTWAPDVQQYYLHIFSPEQPDLNWQNPTLRAEIHEMMRWWLDRGIAGFRMDVISLIGKDVDAGIDEEGPHLHAFLQEMHREVLARRDIVTIGESWSVSRDTALLYCGRARGELDMVFQFNHVTARWDELHGKWRPKPFDLPAFKRILFEWQHTLADDGWNSLFLSNHDLPRQVSTYGDDGVYRAVSAKTLATAMHLLKGTPFVYQGEEIGMTNARFDRIDQFRDIETLRHYGERIADGVSPEAFLAGANANGRDNARTPMQWNDAAQAGFTDGTPWIEVNQNFAEVNVMADRADPDGVFQHYRRLISLRREHDIVAFGRTVPIAPDDREVFCYARELDGDRVTVVANFTSSPVTFEMPAAHAAEGAPLIATHTARTRAVGRLALAPWESFAILDSPG